MRSRRVHWALVLLWIIMLLGGGRAPSDAFAGRAEFATPPATAIQQLSPAGKASLQEYLDAAQLPDLQYPDFRNYRTEAKEFYEAAENALPWVLEGHLSPQARSIIRVLELADDEGLNPVDYDGPRWDARVATIDSGRATESELVRFDLSVTISTMRYISDLHRGRVNPREFHFELDIESKNIDLSEFLRQRLVNAQDVQTTMRTVEPPFPGYHRTIDALKTYRTLASEEDAELAPMPPKPVKPGDSYGGVTQLNKRLKLLGDLPQTDTAAVSDRYRGNLVTAVKHFQKRHGLDANGILDAHTFKELNTPLSQRIDQLQLTLERWRWLPHEFQRPPIVVNIPEFRVYAANEENRVALSMKVVVGRSYKHQTPVFAAELKTIIFRPYWNVPLSIQRKELLPEIRKNPDYLQKHSYEVVDSKGNVASDGPVSEEMRKELYSGKLAIRQRPGDENSLGLVKFDFPNVHDVYMHGTPATQLFSRSRRDFSHGCIRVEDPVALAAWVLRDQPGWDTDHILAAMNGEETLRVSVPKPIPVLILYGTATVTEDGEIHFFDDIYKLDAALGRVLAKGYPYSADE